MDIRINYVDWSTVKRGILICLAAIVFGLMAAIIWDQDRQISGLRATVARRDEQIRETERALSGAVRDYQTEYLRNRYAAPPVNYAPLLHEDLVGIRSEMILNQPPAPWIR